MKFFFLCIYLFIVSNILSVYRPYDIYRTSAHSLAEGGTGTANVNSISGIPFNPAYLAAMYRGGISLGMDAQIRITRLKTDVSLKPQYVPIVNAALSIDDNSGIGVSLHSPFKRVFPDISFIAYFWEVGYGYTISRYLDAGITLGGVMGIEAERYVGGGFSFSLGLLSQNEYVNIGLFFRLGSNINYSTFSRGVVVSEKLPHLIRLGFYKKWELFSITLELEYIDWRSSSFKEFGIETKPQLETHFLDFLHPHIGFAFELSRWLPGITLRSGFYTEDFFEYNGTNNRQILWSFGFSGLAYTDFWKDRLRIDVAYVTSALLSLFWEENNQIDKFQISVNYSF